MPRFRPRISAAACPPGDVAALLDAVFRAEHFFVGSALPVQWRTRIEETIPWEVYQGRLLPPGQTRERRSFVAWNLLAQTDAEVTDALLVGLKWDRDRREIHVVRGLECFVWEAAGGGGNVVEGRETTRWLLELVGTLALADFTDEEELRDELACRLWQAVVGTSRLPLTSLEAPLPGFVLGQLAYVYRPEAEQGGPLRDWRGVLEDVPLPVLSRPEQSKILEAVLRIARAEEIAEVARRLVQKPVNVYLLLRVMFNEVSLSPWTGLVNNALQLVHLLERKTKVEELEFVRWLIPKLVRHLTAYDLVTFHHRGANYPDALLLDTALKRLLYVLKRKPELFSIEKDGWSGAAARQALLHAAVVRRMYEGHAVPEAPTSPGENTRVLPAPFRKVPEEQLVHPLRRPRKLFADEPLANLWTPRANEVFARALDDLAKFGMVVEFGMATFIDRPLGLGKAPLEPDQTPLLAHEAYSPTIARRRMDALAELARELDVPLPESWQRSRAALEQDSWVDGLPVSRCASLGRPVAALADAQRVSQDFVVRQTLPGSVRRLRELFDWESLMPRFHVEKLWQMRRPQWLRVSAGNQATVLVARDAFAGAAPPRLVFEADPTRGYRCRGGVELPVAGLRIWRLCDDDEREHDLRGEDVRVLPRW